MNCPHCGAEWSDREHNQCYHLHPAFGSDRSIACRDRQISQLKTELSQCVRRDDPRLENILQVLDDGSYGHSSWQKSAAAKATLQSIIEGK